MNEIYRECMKSIADAAFQSIADAAFHQMCEELVRVQPINIDFKALRDDPFCNMMLSNSIARRRGEPLPFRYE